MQGSLGFLVRDECNYPTVSTDGIKCTKPRLDMNQVVLRKACAKGQSWPIPIWVLLRNVLGSERLLLVRNLSSVSSVCSGWFPVPHALQQTVLPWLLRRNKRKERYLELFCKCNFTWGLHYVVYSFYLLLCVLPFNRTLSNSVLEICLLYSVWRRRLMSNICGGFFLFFFTCCVCDAACHCSFSLLFASSR